MIFCVGLGRTGSTSLEKALIALGFRVAGWRQVYSKMDEELGLDMNYMREKYDAVSDGPTFLNMHEARDGDRLILTLREDIDSWLSSFKDHYSRAGTASPKKRKLRQKIFGTALFNAGAFKKTYAERKKAVRKFAEQHNIPLLEMDICAGDGWEKLCPFLGSELITQCRFPHENKGRKQ